MFYEIKKPGGLISLDKAVIGSIVKRETAVLEGRALLSSAKGRLLKTAAGSHDDGNFFEAAWTEEGVVLRVFVVLRLGTSIRAVTDRLLHGLRTRTEECIGLPVKSVSVVVTGVLSKNLSRRNFEARWP